MNNQTRTQALQDAAWVAIDPTLEKHPTTLIRPVKTPTGRHWIVLNCIYCLTLDEAEQVLENGYTRVANHGVNG